MDSKKYDFLKAVLGQDGAAALKKAADRLGGLEDAVLPRAIMAWLAVAARGNYEGQIPGVDDSYLDFTKNTNGSYSGWIAMGEEVFPFHNATPFHLAASVSLALGAEKINEEFDSVDLVKLGKSIDIMAKAKYVSNLDNLVKKQSVVEGKPGPAQVQTVNATIAGGRDRRKQTPPTGVQIGQPEPVGPQPEKPATSARKPTVKVPKLKISMTTKHECGECGLPLIKNDKFVGCMCFKDVARYVQLTKSQGETYISFDPALDQDGIATILETLGVSHG